MYNLIFYKLLFTALFCCFIITVSSYPQTTRSFLKIPYDNKEVIVDGKIDDWGKSFTYRFKDTCSSYISPHYKDLSQIYPRSFDFSLIKRPKSRNTVIVRAFWNMNSINFAITVFDKQLFAEVRDKKNKPRIHLNDGVEIYIDTQNDSSNRMDINDYQFQIDIKNDSQVFRGERYLINIDTLAVPKDYDQNILFKSAVSYTGTINDPSDIDSFYVVEVSIPFVSIGIESKVSHRIRLDIAVNDIDYPAANETYIEYASTNMWAFDWVGYNDLGYPDYWKPAVLTGEPSWIDNLSVKYKAYWANIFFVVLAVTLVIVSWLIIRINKLKSLPTVKELNEKNIILIHSGEINHLSYNKRILAKASDFIVAHKHENLHSEGVAAGIGISLRNFQRITKEELNLAPTSYIYIVKLKLALDYLKNGEGNVTDAAYEFGFSDPSYFSKIFKKHFGKSPSEVLHKT